MKTINHKYFWLLFWAWIMAACDSSDAPLNGYIETTEGGSSTLILKGYEDVTDGFCVFQPDGFDSPFYIKEQNFYGLRYLFSKDTATRLEAMGDRPSTWQEGIDIEEGATYWAKYISMAAYKYVRFRVAYISENNVAIEYVIDSTEERPNTNANTASGDYVTNVEMPSLDAENIYVAHTVQDGQNGEVLNYALEWNASMLHANWVAFSFDALTSADYVTRTDAWNPDPLLPEDARTDNSFHTYDGFDRGHICASEDRVWSEEANEQTFYFSNISPQLSGFNQNFWAALEQQVRTWGRAMTDYDKVYVVKGGTLNRLLTDFTGSVAGGDGVIPVTDSEGFTSKGLPCPAYYFMAVLTEKGNTYHAIAFLVPHREDLPEAPVATDFQEYAMSIDKLEEAVGLDLFCNLPDDLEEEVEDVFDVNLWNW